MRCALFALMALCAACGCITGLGPETKDSAKDTAQGGSAEAVPAAQVATAWQKDFEKLFAADPKAEVGYGLFSEGGWADAGQFMIFVDAGGARLVHVPAGRVKAEPERPLTASEWETIRPLALAGAELASINVLAFDQLVFDFVRATKGKGIDRRFHYANPGKVKSPAHEDLIGAFLALGKPAKPAN